MQRNKIAETSKHNFLRIYEATQKGWWSNGRQHENQMSGQSFSTKKPVNGQSSWNHELTGKSRNPSSSLEQGNTQWIEFVGSETPRHQSWAYKFSPSLFTGLQLLITKANILKQEAGALRVWGPGRAQPWNSSRWPWCLPPWRWWPMTWASIRAGWAHLPCHSCWSVPSQWSEDPGHAVSQRWGCSHCLRSYESALLQQLWLNSPSGSRKQQGCLPCCSWNTKWA